MTSTVSTTKSVIANYLLDNVGAWIDTATFDDLAGGPSGGRRMRELRENGWNITSRRAPGDITRQHRLVKAPSLAIQRKYRPVARKKKVTA